MLTGNHFFKHQKILNPLTKEEELHIVPITTDDIPEGKENRYNLNYIDGKRLGDIVIRFAPADISCHVRLNGSPIYSFEYPEFYDYVTSCRDTYRKGGLDHEDYEYFDKTNEEYEEFLDDHDNKYCPYFVIVDNVPVTVYEVTYNDEIGYTRYQKAAGEKVPQGYIYNQDLQAIAYNISEWEYTGESISATTSTIKVPTIMNNLNGDDHSFYYVVTRSRVPNESEDDRVSFRSVKVGETYLVAPGPDVKAEVVEAPGSTLRNQIWDFYIPNGLTASVDIGEVTTGDVAAVDNAGTKQDAVFNFTLPRGPKGDAGTVLVLTYLQDSEPSNPHTGERWYDVDNNIIKVYNGNNEWATQEYSTPNSGMLYLFNSVVYYYNGSTLVQSTATISSKQDTLLTDNQLVYDVIGVRGNNNNAYGVWVGTKSEYEIEDTNNRIPENAICFITEDPS